MKGARHPLFINIQAHFHQEFYVELAEALTLDYWTKDWTKSFYLKLDFLNCNTLQALINAWLPYTDISALQTQHLLTKYTCTHLTSRHPHTLALNSISLYTLATYGTHFTFLYNFTHLSLGALWYSLTSLHNSLSHLITSIYTRCMLVRKPTWSF